MDIRSRYMAVINAFVIGAIAAIVFVAAATIGGELYAPFKSWLANAFGHHWVGKGVIASVVFVALGGLFPFLRVSGQRRMYRMFWLLLWVSILGFASIAGFYTYEAFLIHG